MKKLFIATLVVTAHTVPVFAALNHDRDAGPTTRAQLQAKVQEHFTRLDADKDGAVTQAEFDAHRTAMRTQHRAELFAKLDTDKNGQLSQAEFNAPRPERGEGEHRGRWGMHHGGMGMHMGMGGKGGGNWFARIDTNKDGKVTLAEASQQALTMFDKADANKDGTVTPEERKAAWEAKRAERAKTPG